MARERPPLYLVPKKRAKADTAQRFNIGLGRLLAAHPEMAELVGPALEREVQLVTEHAAPDWRFSMTSEEFLPKLLMWAAAEAPRSAREANYVIAAFWPSRDRRDGRLTLSNKQIAEKVATDAGFKIDPKDVGRCLNAMARAGFLTRMMEGREVIYALSPWVATKLGPSLAAAARDGRPKPFLVASREQPDAARDPQTGRYESEAQPELL